METKHINHKRVWLAIIVGSLMMLLYYYNLNINNLATMQIVMGEMIISFPFLIIGAYTAGFIIKYITQIKQKTRG